MNRKMSRTVIGLFLVLMGISVAGNLIFHGNHLFSFARLWPLLIVVPCILSIIEKGYSTGKAIGLVIGVFLFASTQPFLPMRFFGKLFGTAILIIIGLSVLGKSSFGERKRFRLHGEVGPNDYVGIFSSRDVRYPGEKFYGCTADAIFGGVEIDLREAIFEEDTVIEAAAIFGGIDILVPPHVRVKVSSVPIFGSVGNKTIEPEDINAPTIFLNATCMFGGVDVK